MKRILLALSLLIWTNIASADLQLIFTDSNSATINLCDLTSSGCTISSISPLAGAPDLELPFALAIDTNEKRAYVVDLADGSNFIKSFDTDSKNQPQEILNSSQLEADLALDAAEDQLYYIDVASGRDLKVIDVSNPANPTTLVSSISQVDGAFGVALDTKNRKFYWSDIQGSTRTVKRRNYGDTTGASEETVFTLSPGTNNFDIAVLPENGTVYVADQGDDRIYRINIDGSDDLNSATVIDSSGFNPDQIIVDTQNQKLLWTSATDDIDSFNSIINRSELDGSLPTVLFNQNTSFSIVSAGGLGIIYDPPAITPSTTIEVPPLISISDNGHGNDVTFTFQDFGDVVLSLGLQSYPTILPLLPSGTSAVRYEVEASQGSGNTKTTYKAKVSKGAETTIKNFGAGAWVAHYKAVVGKARTADKVEQLTDKFQSKLDSANPNSKKAVRLKNVLLKLDAKFKRLAEPQSPDAGFNIE